MAARNGAIPVPQPAPGRGILLLLAMLLALFGAFQAFAQQPAADPSSPRARLDAIRYELTQIEATLAAPTASEAELQRQRMRLQPSLDQLRQLIDEQAPRVEQAKIRLDQLGPKPDASAPPESAEVLREREARTKAFADADETMKIARAAFLQAEQLQTAIGDRRRALFTQALFAAGPSVLSPDMWGNALSTVPEDLRASGYIFGGWLSGFSDAMSSVRGGLILLAFGGALLLYYLRRRYLPRFKARFSNAQSGDSLHCLYI